MTFRKAILMAAATIEYFLNHYSDGLDDLYHPGRYLYNSFEGSADRRSVQQTLSLLVSKKLLKRKGNKGYYDLTPAGWLRIGAVFQSTEAKKNKWDGLWRIVVYDVPEEKSAERNYLRRRLKELGFRLWQKSTWITPFNVSMELYDLLEEKKMSGRISVFESRNLFGLSDRVLASKVWGLDNLRSNYENFISAWERGKSHAGKDTMKIRELAKRLQLQYFELTQKDPHLPTELLPEKWPSKQLKIVLSEILSTLSY